MTKIGEFFKTQMIKAGVDLNAENNKAFVDILPTLETEIPDQITGIINGSLISIKEAKNNHTDIKNHYTAQALDNLDREIENLTNEFELPDADKDQLKLERSSYKRAAMLTKKVKELTELKASANKPDQAKINQQISALNAEIASEKTGRATDKAAYEAKEKNMIKTYALDGTLAQYKTIYDTLPGQARNVGIRACLEEELRNNAAKFDLDKDGNLSLFTSEGQTFFDPATNTQLNAKQFIEKVLAKNKLLVTNQIADPQQSGNTNGTAQSQNGQPDKATQTRQNEDAATSLIRELNGQSSADYKSAPVM